MTDNAEMGERPADPALRGGVGVGAGTDDAQDGAAEQQAETHGRANDPSVETPASADLGAGAPQDHSFADDGALANRMSPVDDWGTGAREQPQESPTDEIESST
jgi:hypothetical protein